MKPSLLPQKHVRPTESLLGLGALVLESLDEKPRNLDSVWADLCERESVKMRVHGSVTLDNVVLAIDFLYSIEAVTLNEKGYSLMRLLELSANQPSFHTVTFNRQGLSLIVGRKADPDDHSREHSTNGVGKSLLLYLISFCLGAKENPELKENLPDWDFTLAFEHQGQKRTVTRSTENQNTVSLDSEEIGLSDYTDWLGEELFQLTQPMKYLTFRSLLSLFLRVGKPAYIAYDQTAKREQEYVKQLRAAYLLGLDEHLVDKKRELREEQQTLDGLRKQFKKDSFLRDYYLGERDAELELKDLEEEIERLKQEVANFRVAENYEQIATTAEQTRREWTETRNDLSSLRSALRQIVASLSEQPDLSAEEVRAMYEAASVELPDLVTRQLEEVTQFHAELIESRSRRLTAEKHQIERRISESQAQLTKLDEAKNEFYQFLGSHGALREYEALLATLADRQREADRLQDFRKLQEECQERSQKNKLEMSEENIRATEYLKVSKKHVDELNDRFRSMARRIWPGKTSGLTVHNNEGANKTRFDIEAKIQTDASDGVSESKIFCFDMTVLLGSYNHSIKFLMHDNRLYPGIDPRQRAEVFRIADSLCRENDCQYIASLNEDNLSSMQSELAPEEYQDLLTSATILNLTDDSQEGKLLGVNVDMDYDSPKKKQPL